MINAGAIMCCSLIKMTESAADRYVLGMGGKKKKELTMLA